MFGGRLESGGRPRVPQVSSRPYGEEPYTESTFYPTWTRSDRDGPRPWPYGVRVQVCTSLLLVLLSSPLVRWVPWTVVLCISCECLVMRFVFVGTSPFVRFLHLSSHLLWSDWLFVYHSTIERRYPFVRDSRVSRVKDRGPDRLYSVLTGGFVSPWCPCRTTTPLGGRLCEDPCVSLVLARGTGVDLTLPVSLNEGRRRNLGSSLGRPDGTTIQVVSYLICAYSPWLSLFRVLFRLTSAVQRLPVRLKLFPRPFNHCSFVVTHSKFLMCVDVAFVFVFPSFVHFASCHHDSLRRPSVPTPPRVTYPRSGRSAWVDSDVTLVSTLRCSEGSMWGPLWYIPHYRRPPQIPSLLGDVGSLFRTRESVRSETRPGRSAP